MSNGPYRENEKKEVTLGDRFVIEKSYLVECEICRRPTITMEKIYVSDADHTTYINICANCRDYICHCNNCYYNSAEPFICLIDRKPNNPKELCSNWKQRFCFDFHEDSSIGRILRGE
jgi:hypothetical protein